MIEIVLTHQREFHLETKQASDLLSRVGRDQDKEAFELLFHYFAPRIKSYMFKLGSNETEAEELTQKTFLQIWRKAPLFDQSKAAASTWIFRVARNLRIDSLRKDSRLSREELDFDTIEDTKDSPETMITKTQQAVHVRNAISYLNKQQSEIIKLSFYEGLSHSRISEKLGIPLGTVKSRIRLAFSKIRRQLGDQYHD